MRSRGLISIQSSAIYEHSLHLPVWRIYTRMAKVHSENTAILEITKKNENKLNSFEGCSKSPVEEVGGDLATYARFNFL